MIETTDFIHYTTIAVTVSFPAIGVGIGQGMIGATALEATNLQPSAQNDIVKTAVLGTALAETSAIIGLVIAIMILFGVHDRANAYAGLAKIGIALAFCLPGLVTGIMSALPAQYACRALARQPFFAQKITRLMLITQTLIQTPVIFSFIIAMLIKSQALLVTDTVDAIRLIASGLCIGLGTIGPTIGLAFFARAACQALGTNRDSYESIMSFTFVSEAIIETPIVFSLVISLLLITIGTLHEHPLVASFSMIGAALCMGLGTIGPGIASGKTASAACKEIGKNPENYAALSKVSMFGQGLIDTCAIYTMIIAIMLILF